ncbi:hypothetical protein FA10DRAFT_265346 [Acaromyces ingoldii]|uniref:Uncharacterized protein n=1 Tax=Acaromyces ingoldii TaxID=215250 RepID=A0A316YQC4_9BASI|nr:hypothetical protein FA10DRAFT_265346 [Acaromyces ingoldii]PWN91489.1 hypothetical protein FA10DRAFT_265346 [Acaromyces ingoldii]
MLDLPLGSGTPGPSRQVHKAPKLREAALEEAAREAEASSSFEKDFADVFDEVFAEMEQDARRTEQIRADGPSILPSGDEGITISPPRDSTLLRDPYDPPWKNPDVDALHPKVWKLLQTYSHPDDDEIGVAWKNDDPVLPVSSIDDRKRPVPGSQVRKKCHKCYMEGEPCVWSALTHGPIRCLRCEEARVKFCNADGRIPQYWTNPENEECREKADDDFGDAQGKFLLAYYLETLQEVRARSQGYLPEANLDFMQIASSKVGYIKARPWLRRSVKLGLLAVRPGTGKRKHGPKTEVSRKRKAHGAEEQEAMTKGEQRRPFISTPSQQILMREVLETRQKLRQLEREVNYLADKARRDFERLLPYNQDEVLKADQVAVQEEQSRDERAQGEDVSLSSR